MSFQGVDYYDVDGMLEPEERAVRDMVRDWVEEEVMPIIQRHYVGKTFPSELIPQMAELGFLGANLPEKYGCAGLNNVAYGIIMQELERGDSGLRSFASVQGALVMYPIHAFGSEEQRETWLPAPGVRREDRVLRPHRAGLRLEPRRHAHPGRQGRGRVGAERREDVDHQRLDGGRGRGVGQDGRGRRRRRRSGASSSRPTGRASRPGTRRASCPSWPRTRASWCSRTCACRTPTSCPGAAA